jgi:hypothetical protein
MPQRHFTAPRGFEFAPTSLFIEGRFGRLFRNLPSFEPDESALHDLAESMREPAEISEQEGAGSPPARKGTASSPGDTRTWDSSSTMT